ncbi:MAG: hypothetical protein WBQ26_06795, partial [Gemmatimonadaceae bacterium]
GFGFGRGGGGAAPPNFRVVNGAMIRVLTTLEPGDMAPNPPMRAGYAAACEDLRTAANNWRAVVTKDLPAFNATLKQNGLPAIAVPAAVAAPGC